MISIFYQYQIIKFIFYAFLLIGDAIATPAVRPRNNTNPLLANEKPGNTDVIYSRLRNRKACALHTCSANCSATPHPTSKSPPVIKFPNAATRESSTLHENSTNSRRKRALAALLDIHDPRRYIALLSRYISRQDHWAGDIIGQTTTVGTVDFRGDRNARSAAGVRNLNGSTSVLAVSSRGVFFAHISENGAFVDRHGHETDDETFLLSGWEVLWDGTYDANAHPIDPGLEDASVMGEVLARGTNPRIFILTPWTTNEDREAGTSTTFLYQHKIGLLARKLRNALYQDPEVIGYTRRPSGETDGDRLRRGSHAGFGGRAIVEWDSNERVLNNCRIGQWRLWLEDRMIRAGQIEELLEDESGDGTHDRETSVHSHSAALSSTNIAIR